MKYSIGYRKFQIPAMRNVCATLQDREHNTAVLLRKREKDEPHFKNAGKDEIQIENQGKEVLIFAC